MQAIPGVETQGLGEKLEAGGQPLPAQAPLHPLHRQRLKICPQTNLDFCQGHIGHDLGHTALRHIQPGTQGATALTQVNPQRHVMTQL